MLRTPRLRLVPLTCAQLEAWVRRSDALERELGCRFGARTCSAEFRIIVLAQRARAAADPANHLLYTFWLLIAVSEGIVVGSACFKGPPDASGAVEIGYGLEKAYEKMGYMTEAAEALRRWVLCLPDTISVLAETEPGNLASQRVLLRLGFHLCGPVKPGWWILNK